MYFQRYQKQIIGLLNWLFILMIVWLWAKFTFNNNAQNIFENTGSTSYKQITPENLNTTSVAQYHIFGSAQQLYDIPLSQGQTSLDFTLNGTMSSTDAKTGMAYISSAQGVQKKFMVGDEVFKLATLKEVYKTYVVIQHNGKNERLQLSESSQMVQSQSSPKNKKTLAKTKPDYLKHLNGNQNRNWQQMMDEQKFDPNKISKIVNNINIVSDQMGNVKGLRVSNIAGGDLLSKNGLKSNDIITGINGNPVSAKNLLTIKETLTTNPNATVTIKRNGKTQDIKINLNDI